MLVFLFVYLFCCCFFNFVGYENSVRGYCCFLKLIKCPWTSKTVNGLLCECLTSNGILSMMGKESAPRCSSWGAVFGANGVTTQSPRMPTFKCNFSRPNVIPRRCALRGALPRALVVRCRKIRKPIFSKSIGIGAISAGNALTCVRTVHSNKSGGR